MARKIILFNHKGGVSKTTSTFNIGWNLANKGHKVLLVDGDSQCNLTSLFLGDQFYNYYESDTAGNNLMDGVKKVFEGTPSPIEAIDCASHATCENLWLLPGHMNISEYEPQLTMAITASVTLAALRNIPGAFNYLIDECAKKYEIDYVLIDLNPGLSTMNQIMFICSDAFIIPLSPDIFSQMAITSLAKILPNWIINSKIFRDSFASSIYPLPNIAPKYIGELIQRYNIRNQNPAQKFSSRIDSIKAEVRECLAPALKKQDMLFNKEQYSQANIDTDYCIGEIPDFQSLGQIMQLTGKPVFALSKKDLKDSGNVGHVAYQQQEKVNTFRGIFDAISDKIVKLT